LLFHSFRIRGLSIHATIAARRIEVDLNMVDSSIFWLRVAAVLYAMGLLHSMLAILKRRNDFYGFALGAFRVGVVLQGVAIVELAMAEGRLPVENFYGTINLCAFLIALAFLFVDWRYHFASTSIALFPLVFLMTLVAGMRQPAPAWSDVRVRDAWLIVHIVLVLVGYAALLLTAVSSIFYLIQERRLKSKKSPSLLEKLPPLGTLDDLISTSMGFGFVFITLGVIFGVLWAYIELGTRWVGNASISLSFVTWGLCLAMIFMRASAGWRGRKAALMALVVLGCGALTWVAHAGLRPTLIP
jgi:ABC-type transport system involved in cytochrome c biogenesis permease subunit